MSVHVQPTFDLINTYVHLEDGPIAEPIAVSADFWATIDKRIELHCGRLVTLFHIEITDEWVHWEMHPGGDELVYLLSGAIDLVFQEKCGEHIIELRSRAASLIPRGVWHRATVHAPSDVLFITRGEGTQLRPIEKE